MRAQLCKDLQHGGLGQAGGKDQSAVSHATVGDDLIAMTGGGKNRLQTPRCLINGPTVPIS